MQVSGAQLGDVLSGIVTDALKKLPIPKMMRWGDSDVQFVRLSKALDAGSVYVAQQVVREIKTKFINATPLVGHAAHAMPASHPPSRPHQPDGMHFVDTRA